MRAIGCALVLTVFSLAQSAEQRAEAKVSTLLALERMWNQGQLSRDAAALQLLLGENFIDTEWDGSVSNREQFLADIRNPKFKPSVMANRDMRVDLYGTAAVVTGTYHAKGTSLGKPYDHVGRFTDVGSSPTATGGVRQATPAFRNSCSVWVGMPASVPARVAPITATRFH